jgi:ABC-type branched-subunit amino acid transport system substrate-binding protein
VTSDLQQALVVYQLIEDRTKAALFSIDDAYGVTFRVEIEGHASATPLVIDEVILTDANQTDLDAAADIALAANRAGTVNTVVIAGLVEHAGPMIKHLVEATPPYAGAIIVPDGGVENGTFLSQTNAFTTWLGVAGNTLRGTAPDTATGTNSTAWLDRYITASGDEGVTPFTPTYADCLYSMLIALSQGTADGETGAAAIKAGMPKQKVSNLGGEVVNVDPSAGGLSDAIAAIEAGSAVRLDGASGLIEFDDDGDRASQNFTVFEPEGTGPYTWLRDEVWDPTIGECVLSCDD